VNDSIFALLSQMLFAIFGTCVRWVQNHPPKTRSLAVLCTAIFTAAFLGLVIHYAVQWLGWPNASASVGSSIAGYKGMHYVEGLIDRIVESVMHRFFPEKN